MYMFILLQQKIIMKKFLINLFIVTIVAGFIFSVVQFPKAIAGSPDGCDIDTARIAIVEFTVLGMDSITITNVQDVLDTACGVNFNFACWNDTVVFVEYDSLLTNKYRLMNLIEDLGFVPSIRLEY